MNIKEIREELEIKLKPFISNLLDDNKKDKQIEEIIDYIETIFKETTQIQRQEIFKGEFSCSSIGEDYNLIPFYLYMQIVIDILEQMFKTQKNESELEPIINKFKQFRDNTKNMEYNECFNPDKHLANNFVNKLKIARSHIILDTISIEGQKFITITFNEIEPNISMRRDGDYKPNGAIMHRQTDFLYKEDEEKYLDIKQSKLESLNQEYVNILQKYLKDGKMPKYLAELEQSFLDSNTIYGIKDNIKSLLIVNKKYHLGELTEEQWLEKIEKHIKDIKRLEKQVNQKQSEPKTKETELKLEKAETQIPEKRSKREIFKEILELLKEAVGYTSKDNNKSNKKK